MGVGYAALSLSLPVTHRTRMHAAKTSAAVERIAKGLDREVAAACLSSSWL